MGESREVSLGACSDSTYQRIVHFDMKGAPPKKPYLFQVLHAIKTWGATGVLIEWECTFPYTSNLVSIGSLEERELSDCMYKMDDVKAIIAHCQILGLEVIQLIQTAGYLEYVLKQEKYSHLRESSDCLVDICLCKSEAKQLLKAMIVQLLAVDKHPKYFHIGGEAGHIGICNDCVKLVTKSPQDNWHLYLKHVQEIANFVKQQCPNVTVLIWDDVLRLVKPEILKEYNLGGLLQPVMCNFDRNNDFFYIEDTVWSLYKEVFPAVWTGCSFRGANGSCAMVCDKNVYLKNQAEWINKMYSNPGITFAGNIFIGRSRYEHFATFCELLPLSIECLASSLKLWTGVMNLKDLYDYSLPEIEWPGGRMAATVSRLNTFQEFVKSIVKDQADGYMNFWRLQKGFVNRKKIEDIVSNINWARKVLTDLELKIITELHRVTGERSANEWLETNVASIYRQLDSVEKIAKDTTGPVPDPIYID